MCDTHELNRFVNCCGNNSGISPSLIVGHHSMDPTTRWAWSRKYLLCAPHWFVMIYEWHVCLATDTCQYICENWCVYLECSPPTNQSGGSKILLFWNEETWYRWCRFEVFLQPGNDVLKYQGMSCISLVKSTNPSLNCIYIEDWGNHVMERLGILEYTLSALNNGLECTRHPHCCPVPDLLPKCWIFHNFQMLLRGRTQLERLLLLCVWIIAFRAKINEDCWCQHICFNLNAGGYIRESVLKPLCPKSHKCVFLILSSCKGHMSPRTAEFIEGRW